MSDILDAARLAMGLLLGLNAALLHIIALSLAVSLSATAVAAVVGLPLEAAVAVFRFRGRSLLVLLVNALLGLPPVVVGLLLYVLLSRSGPLGMLGILFTPTAMVVAQSLLVFSPGIWWSGFVTNLAGSACQARQMASYGVSPRSVLRRRPKL